jgi:hypothetical protein
MKGVILAGDLYTMFFENAVTVFLYSKLPSLL